MALRRLPAGPPLVDSTERRVLLHLLERDFRAIEHLGNLLWLPEKIAFEEWRDLWRKR